MLAAIVRVKVGELVRRQHTVWDDKRRANTDGRAPCGAERGRERYYRCDAGIC